MVKQHRKQGIFAFVASLIYNATLIAVFNFAGIKQGLLESFLLVLLLSLGTFFLIRLFFMPSCRKAGEEEQPEEITEPEEVERYRKDFLGNVSHELKTPIFNIQGYLLTLLDGAIEDESVNRLYLKRAEKSINRLNSIVEDLDSMARLESGEFKLSLESFNLVKVLEEVIEDLEMTARQHNIRISLEGNYQKVVRVKADRKLIIEVLENLVHNSIKYGKEGGKTTISFTEKGKKIFVSIRDNGIGIEKSHLPRIFERFFRVDKSRSRESGGTGLGLSIVKHTLQAHKQDISVQSKVGSGSTFTFSLKKAE